MDSHKARALLRTTPWLGHTEAKQQALATLVCDIHEWMEECMGLWHRSQEADRGEVVPAEDLGIDGTITLPSSGVVVHVDEQKEGDS